MRQGGHGVAVILASRQYPQGGDGRARSDRHCGPSPQSRGKRMGVRGDAVCLFRIRIMGICRIGMVLMHRSMDTALKPV